MVSEGVVGGKRAADRLLLHGWAPGSGEAYAQVADAEDPRQRAIFEALMSNAYAPDIMYGCYYAGDYTRLQ